jgi:transposase-like protein
MAPQEYDFEMRQQAHDLYVIGGLTFEQVARTTGVSESQLKRWSAEEREWAGRRGEDDPKDWPDLRKEFRMSQSSAARQAVVLRALLISNALSSRGEYKQVLSAAMWEKTQGPGARGQGSGASCGRVFPAFGACR